MDRLTSNPDSGQGEPTENMAPDEIKQLEADIEANSGDLLKLP